MTDSDLHHFLLVYDIPRAHAEVHEFAADYDRAQAAYAEHEATYRDDPSTEVVLLSSDSLDTLRKTHASYFELTRRHLDEFVRRELDDALAAS